MRRVGSRILGVVTWLAVLGVTASAAADPSGNLTVYGGYPLAIGGGAHGSEHRGELALDARLGTCFYKGECYPFGIAFHRVNAINAVGGHETGTSGTAFTVYFGLVNIVESARVTIPVILDVGMGWRSFDNVKGSDFTWATMLSTEIRIYLKKPSYRGVGWVLAPTAGVSLMGEGKNSDVGELVGAVFSLALGMEW